MFRLMLVSCVSMIRSVRCIVIVLGRRALWCIANSVLQSRPSSGGRPCGSALSCMRSSSFSSSQYRCILSCLMPSATGWRGCGHHCLDRPLGKVTSQAESADLLTCNSKRPTVYDHRPPFYRWVPNGPIRNDTSKPKEQYLLLFQV